MILIFFPNKQIHQIFTGFGEVTTVNGTLHIDGRDTTTCAADVQWKYIDEQRIERDENGFVRNADYYLEASKPVTIAELQEQLAATNAVLLDIYLGGV